MSIAISAIVRPSRLLSLLIACMCLLAASVAVAIGGGFVGEDLDPMARFVLTSISGFLALFGFCHGSRLRKTIHIDISGSGVIRIQSMEVRGACSNADWPHVRESGERVHLLAESTIWPQMLLLHLQSEGGKITVFPVFPGCVSPDSFRALAVACRWIAGHVDVSSGKASEKF